MRRPSTLASTGRGRRRAISPHSVGPSLRPFWVIRRSRTTHACHSLPGSKPPSDSAKSGGAAGGFGFGKDVGDSEAIVLA
jgi:hypothetical protein